jgi:hypothetical protein
MSQTVLNFRLLGVAYVVAYDHGKAVRGEGLLAGRKKLQGYSVYSHHYGQETKSVDEILTLLLYAERGTYSEEYIRRSNGSWAVLSGIKSSIDLNGKTWSDLETLVIIHEIEIGVLSVYIMIATPTTSLLTTDEVIAIEQARNNIRINYGGTSFEGPTALSEFLMHRINLEGKARFVYPFVTLQTEGVTIEDAIENHFKEIYGIVDSDGWYNWTKDDLAKSIAKKAGGVLPHSAVYWEKDRGIVIFDLAPDRMVEGLWGCSIDTLPEKLDEVARSFEAELEKPVDQLALRRCAPYIDYFTELEPLLVQLALLRRFEEKLRSLSRSVDEMAALKTSVSEELDFYYFLNYQRLTGVTRGLERARATFGVDELLKKVSERRDLIRDTLEIYYSRRLEIWQSIFTIVLTVFGFGSLFLAFLTSYFKDLPVGLSLVLFSGVTALVTVVVILAAKYLSEKTVMRIGEHS